MFDPSMFQSNPGGGDYSGLFAKLQQILGQQGQAGAPPGQAGAGAMASASPMAASLVPPPQGQMPPQGGPPMPQMPQGAPGAPQGGGFMDSLKSFMGNNRAGLAGVSQFIGGGGLNPQLMNQGVNQDYQRNMQQGSLAGTYQALKSAGLPEGLARAAALNPELLKTIAPQYFSKPTWGKISTDMLGHDVMGWINPNTQTISKPGAPAGGSSGAAGMDPAEWGAMAPEDRLAKMDPQVQGEIKAIYEGRQTGTGRNVQQLLPLVNQVYPDFTMQDYNAKKVMRDDLNKSGNSSMGGILANGKSAFAHLADTSDALAALGSASHDFPGGGGIATMQNWVGSKLAGSDMKGKITAANDTLGHYGQESTKFYAGTGGGVEERTAAMKNADPSTSSSEEQAAYLQSEKGLMLDRLHQKENQVRQALGDDYLQKNPIVTPELQQTIARIDANIAKLRGKAPAAPGAGAAAGPAQGAQGAPPAPGAKLAPDGQWYVTDPKRPGKYLQVRPSAQGGGIEQLL